MKTISLLIPLLMIACLGAAPATKRAASSAPAASSAEVPDADSLARVIPAQAALTEPNYTVFLPDVKDATLSQTGNEHFLVFEGKAQAGSDVPPPLRCIWTQSTGEGQSDQHIVFARGSSDGKTWSRPRVIAGPAKPGNGPIASWAFPLVSASGRIYVLYSQHVGKHDSFFHTTGRLDGIYSDDDGATWSKPETIDLPRTRRCNPDTSFPANIICWQKPLRLGKDDRYLAGITRWTSRSRFTNPGRNWTSHDSVVEFMRFENIDEDPAVSKIQIAWFASDDKALTVPHPQFPSVSICQEPAIVKLPDGRLFCVMRTMAGSPFWSVSADQGETWSTPERLLTRDGGDIVRHPLSPCPIYDMGGNTAGSGRYALFVHDNDGHFQGAEPHQTSLNRQPLYLLAGRFVKDAHQPVWFDKPKLFMKHDATSLGAPGSKGRADMSLYSSWTVREGRAVLWYPDRKFFLLGRDIGDEWFKPEVRSEVP